MVNKPKNLAYWNRFCSYLWVGVLIPVGRTRSLFDKFQTGCVWETPAQRGRVNRYVTVGIKQTKNFDCDNDLICLEQA
jgi:hypothetical protein